MIECPIQSRDNAGILLDYCDRKLEPDLMAQLDRHLEDCQACREALAGQRMIWQALDAWEPDSISSDFDRRLYDRIEAARRKGWWKRWIELPLPLAWRPGLSVAAACLMVAGFFWYQRPRETDPEVKQAEAIEAEQVESALSDMEMLQQLGVTLEDKSSRQTL